MEGAANVDTKDRTTNEWLGLPCTACTLYPLPEANKLSAELASDGTPTEHGGVAVVGITAEDLGTAIGAALEDARSAARAACIVCKISATISGEAPLVAGPAN